MVVDALSGTPQLCGSAGSNPCPLEPVSPPLDLAAVPPRLLASPLQLSASLPSRGKSRETTPLASTNPGLGLGLTASDANPYTAAFQALREDHLAEGESLIERMQRWESERPALDLHSGLGLRFDTGSCAPPSSPERITAAGSSRGELFRQWSGVSDDEVNFYLHPEQDAQGARVIQMSELTERLRNERLCRYSEDEDELANEGGGLV